MASTWYRFTDISNGLGVLLRVRGFTRPPHRLQCSQPGAPPKVRLVPIHEVLPDEATSPDADIVTQLLAQYTTCKVTFQL